MGVMSPDTLQAALAAQLAAYPAKRYWLGFSGGRDSHVLLDLLYQLRQAGQLDTPLTVIHVNHRLHPNADDWAQRCRTVCQQYAIDFKLEAVIATPGAGDSIEAFARQQRYRLIKKQLSDGDIFLSAHHQRDQAETFLLQLMRSAGLQGLRAMPLIKIFGAGQYLRPLLQVPYADIVAYAEAKQLDFINDDSNENCRFVRNFMRHEVLPLLETRFPAAQAHIAQSAAWLQEIPDLPAPPALFVKQLQLLSKKQQKQQLRAFVKAKTGLSLSQSQTHYILTHHLQAAADKQPTLVVAGAVIRRFAGQIIITKPVPELLPQTLFAVEVYVKQPQRLAIGELTWQSGQGICVSPAQALHIRPLTGSQRFHPHTRLRSTTVKKLLHESGIAPWLRPWYFGLYYGNELLAIPGIGVAKSHYHHGADAHLPLWQIATNFVKL